MGGRWGFGPDAPRDYGDSTRAFNSVRDARQPLAMILSSIGLVFGAAMIRFSRVRSELHPRWWLGWHLNAVLLLSSAVHGTLLAVIYRSLVDPNGFDAAQLVTQPGTLLFALFLRAKIGARRGVPMRFTSIVEPAQATAERAAA